MLRNWMSVFLLVVASALASCDPGIRIDGRVVRGDGAAVSSARVELTCPEAGYSLNGRMITDSAGRFAARGLGCIPKSCEIRGVGPDGATALEKVADHCARSHWYCKSVNCNLIEVDLVLPGAGSKRP